MTDAAADAEDHRRSTLAWLDGALAELCDALPDHAGLLVMTLGAPIIGAGRDFPEEYSAGRTLAAAEIASREGA